MQNERTLRLAAAASVLLLVVAAGAVAGQLQSREEAARLQDQLERMQGKDEADRPWPEGLPSPVFLTRVALVAENGQTAREEGGQAGAGDARTPRVAGRFAVEATVANRTSRTLRQPVAAILVVSDPQEPARLPALQLHQAVVETLAPGDVTTVRMEGFEAQDPRLRHELIVTTPPVDPARIGGTVVKVAPTVLAAAPQKQQPEAPRRPIGPQPDMPHAPSPVAPRMTPEPAPAPAPEAPRAPEGPPENAQRPQGMPPRPAPPPPQDPGPR